MLEATEKNKYLGKFWLPKSGEESAVDGVMELTDQGATVLLHGLLTSAGDSQLNDVVVFARIQGKYKQATLFNCFGSHSRNYDGGINSASIASTLVAFGCLNEDIGGKGVSFRLPHSEKWLNDPCFELDLSYDSSTRSAVYFTNWERHELELSDQIKLERVYAVSLPGSQSGVERFEIQRKMVYRIWSDEKLTFDEQFDHIVRVRRFFEFMMQHHLVQENIGIFEESSSDKLEPDVIIHAGIFEKVVSQNFKLHNFLVHEHKIKGRNAELIKKWIALWVDHPTPMEHYFHAFDSNKNDRVLHFLWNVAALEEFHKIRVGRQKIDLIGRLEEMCQYWGNAFSVAINKDDLKFIKNSRHYYAHAAGDLRTKSVKGWHLYRYGDFLMALSSLEILGMLGFSKDEAIDLTKSNLWMSEALNLQMYPGPDL